MLRVMIRSAPDLVVSAPRTSAWEDAGRCRGGGPDVSLDLARHGFRRWRGRSGRSYLVSTHAIENCPDYSGAVVLAVCSTTSELVWVGEAGVGGDALRWALIGARRAGADEVHVHLLAADAAERCAAIADLAAAASLALPAAGGARDQPVDPSWRCQGTEEAAFEASAAGA